jgi:hypothetical protein
VQERQQEQHSTAALVERRLVMPQTLLVVVVAAAVLVLPEAVPQEVDQLLGLVVQGVVAPERRVWPQAAMELQRWHFPEVEPVVLILTQILIAKVVMDSVVK